MEREEIINCFLCMCFLLFLLGCGIIKTGIDSEGSESGIIIIIGVVLMSISLTILVDYGLHRLWHWSEEGK